MAQQTIQQVFQQAIQHHQSGRLREAEQIYRQILAQQPNHVDALHYLGLMAHQLGKNDVAMDLIRRALVLGPDYAEAHCNLGYVLEAQGKMDEAIAEYRQAVKFKPKFVEAQYNLGVALHKKGQFDEAVAAYHKAIEIKPDHAEAFNGLGKSLQETGQIEPTIAAFRQAVSFKVNFPDALNNLGVALKDHEELDEAIAIFERAISLKPDYAEAYSNLGIALKENGRIDEAVAAYRQAIKLNPNISQAHSNLGNALREKGQFDDAIASFRQAIVAKGFDLPEAHFSLGSLLLLRGEFEHGWKGYEWRWKCSKLVADRNFSQSRWDGSPLEGRTLLLHAEQGFGDTLQFIRYVPMIAGGGKIVIECQPALHRLLKNFYPAAEVIPCGQRLPAFDVHCPLMSLPFVFDTRLDSIPAKVPYLSADASIVDEWAKKLGPQNHRPRVGLVWAGSAIHRNDHNRSIPLSMLSALSTMDYVEFFSLQIGPANQQISSTAFDGRLIDHTNDLHDFADTAGLIANLDLLISVDTAVVHLAGGMGKPVWLLLPHQPDWRWLLDRPDSPWYPTIRLFRQNQPADWNAVIAQVVAALPDWIKDRA